MYKPKEAHLFKILSFLVFAGFISSCTILPFNVGTPSFMKSKKDLPPKVEVTDFDADLVNRHGVRIWIEQPVWGEPIQIAKQRGGFIIVRRTTNRPLLQVYHDSTLTGAECRWESFGLEQNRNTKRADDLSFGTGVARDSKDWHGDGQYYVDCDKVKEVIKTDPRYKSAIKE